MRPVYMDNNATTPIHPAVQEAIKLALPVFGNASSLHFFGQESRKLIDQARENMAVLLGADPDEIIFTSCGSESNNMVLKGVTCDERGCNPFPAPGTRHIITSTIEHPSVRSVCQCLERQGVKVTYIPVDHYGLVDPAAVEKAIVKETRLISIMTANNESGTIEPVKEIAAIAREHGIYFHTDAVQAVGKMQLNVRELGVDFLTLSGHKLYAPKGIGALYIRRGINLCPLLQGGHQEGGLRSGTENTLGIAALGKAAELARKEMDEEIVRLRRLRDKLQDGILWLIPEVKINGLPEAGLPGTLNVTFNYIEGESVLYRLSQKGIAVSTGSACSSGSEEPSYVLLALGLTPHEAQGSIRFSLGRENTDEDVDYVLQVLPGIIQDLRAISPLWKEGAKCGTEKNSE